jgi:hypothetical protein
MDSLENYAQSKIGPDAHPTPRLRVLRDNESARIQQEWVGNFGKMWLDLPIVVVPRLPTPVNHVLFFED